MPVAGVSVARGLTIPGVLLTLLAPGAAAQSGKRDGEQFSGRIEVVARKIYLDVLDSTGRPVDELRPEMLVVIEDGVARPVLEVRRRQAGTGEGAAAAAPPSLAETAAVAPPPQRYVVVALDPVTLGRAQWADAIEHLTAAADALVAIGPVDVVALTAPPLRTAAATRDAAVVRAALARVAESVTALDVFFTRRSRFAYELESAFTDPIGELAVQRDSRAEQIEWALQAARNLAADEEHDLRESLGRLQATMVGTGRPLVAVWAAQGDPDTSEFVRSQLPRWLTNSEVIRFTGPPVGLMAQLAGTWKRWARDGVSVVSWSQAADALLFTATPTTRLPILGHPRYALGAHPLALLEAVADDTGGSLARSVGELEQALATVGGGWELVYQSNNADAGWRELRVEVARPGWMTRTSPRMYVMGAAPREAAPPVEAPLVLGVELDATSRPDEHVGRERVQLPIRVDFTQVRERLAADAEARFVFRILAVPPGGRVVAREVEVRAAALPEGGVLRYETSLIVPRGTSAYAVEVREETTGARGSAGPVEAVSQEWIVTPAPATAPLEATPAPDAP